jgi:hypothetical protein
MMTQPFYGDYKPWLDSVASYKATVAASRTDGERRRNPTAAAT